VIEVLEQFEATLHEASGLVVDWHGGDEASGESACVAHHVTRGEGREGSDLILRGRYTDRFARDEHGTWRFAARELRVFWSEKRPVRLV
jgi:SnoaL-like protein